MRSLVATQALAARVVAVAEGEALHRVGVVGDVHGELNALATGLDALAARGCETILCVGDLVDGPGTDAETEAACRLLRERGVLCIAGNHERWWLANEMRSVPHVTGAMADDVREWIEALPATRRLPTVAGDALLCHGVGDDDLAILYPETKGYALQAVMPALRPLLLDDSLRYAVGGHTHRRMARALPGLTFVNAGTLHRDFEVSVSVIDFAERRVCHVALEGGPESPRAGAEEHVPLPEPLPLA
ncbi:MAG: metallophosphoesterase [Myxococcota bacterium]